MMWQRNYKITIRYSRKIVSPLWVCLFFPFLICVAQDQTAATAHTKSTDLQTTLKNFNLAFRVGNTKQIATMITEDYIHTNGNNKAIGKEEWLGYLKKRERQINSGELQVMSYQMDELKIVYYHDIAIVTARITVINKLKGTLKENAYRVTHVWSYQDGEWKRAGFHDTRIE